MKTEKKSFLSYRGLTAVSRFVCAASWRGIIVSFFILHSSFFIAPLAHAAVRTESSANGARVGMSPTSGRVMRSSAGGVGAETSADVIAIKSSAPKTEIEDAEENEEAETPAANSDSAPGSYKCSDYEECMDAFCMLDESEGERCACSDNINRSKSMIKKINDTQGAAEKLYGEGVEREKLGAKAVLVFGSSDKAKNSRVDLSLWLDSDDDDIGMDEDAQIGDYLHRMAKKSCAERLNACGSDSKMQEMLYERKITADCKSFTTFLGAQQKVADSNLAAAEKAVRAARFAELENTNKYNRGECLIALRNCVAEKGGCGDNFENCLDKGLLARRTKACDNVLDQCMASAKEVKKDWDDETKSILADAEKYSDRYRRQTCLSRIESCLEDTCSTKSNDQCLNNVDVAAGVCPMITECDELVPGIKGVVNNKLGYLRVRFCQNDVTSCFREKCGSDYTHPQCLGKPVSEIAKLCPQSLYPSCAGQTQYEVLVSGILLQMDYAQLQGCINAFSESLGRVCGTDMTCVPEDPAITTLSSVDEAEALLKADPETGDLPWKTYADREVDRFFADLEKDATIGACAENQNPKTKVKGKPSAGTSVFNTAKMIAKINAENRQYRALTSKLRDLAKQADTEKARKACEMLAGNSGTKIDSAVFEPDLRNCHICRTQEVCEEGGEDKITGALKAGAGGLAAGAGAGTMISPGWGTAIGGVVGAVGGGIMGGLSSGKQKFCQEIQSCEDVNM
ncbi:MAG: hypothetical protein LBQ49_01440 [Rickettsiales bacterium]|jgi:hypothetical protein|nr:hypothetical protein [Rickettsiales bacterium]